MLAFAGNSLLCRIALRNTAIDPVTFTSIRLVAGAAALLLIVGARRRRESLAGDWPGALFLAGYAYAFSIAYVALSAATGALLLFGGVQLTMIGYGLAKGESFRPGQGFGILAALAGLVTLLFPGLAAPPLRDAGLMLGAGLSWGVYSLIGRGSRDPIGANAGNFVRAVPLAAVFTSVALPTFAVDTSGILYAIASGALTSGVGYAIWYTALRDMKAVTASAIQLSVPVIAAAGGVALLSEPVTLRLVLASAATLGGIGLVIAFRSSGPGKAPASGQRP